MPNLAVLGLRKPDKYRGEHRKHERLYESYKQFKHIHKYGKQHRHNSHCTADSRAHRHSNEDYRHEGKQCRMTGKYICKQTYRQRASFLIRGRYFEYLYERVRKPRGLR